MLLHIIPQAINFNAIHEIDCQKIIYIAKGQDLVLGRLVPPTHDINYSG
jgi:hypothetical protein